MGEGDLKVTATGDSSGFDQMLNRMKVHGKQAANEIGKDISHSWAGIGKGLVGGIAGALSFETIKGFVSGIFETSKSLRETAEAYDLSTDSVQKWEKALGKAGVTSQTFYRALDTLRQKRQEAREDPKKGGPFSDIGMLGQALDFSISDEELLKRILNSNASRPDIAALMGRRAPQLRAALGFESSAKPILSESDIEMIHGTEQAKNSVWGAIKGFVTKSVANAFNPQNWKDAYEFAGRPAAYRLEKEARELAKKAKQDKEASEDAMLVQRKADYDKMIRDAEEEAKYQVRLLDANRQLRHAKQQNMTIAARHADILKELSDTREEIKAYEGTGAELGPEQRLRLLELKTKEQGLIGEAREKPTGFTADSMAKIGAYSESALFGNPLVSISQQQLRTLNSIDRRLATNRSIFSSP